MSYYEKGERPGKIQIPKPYLASYDLLVWIPAWKGHSMKKNYLLAGILIMTLLLFLGIGSFMDAAAAQVTIDTPMDKPTTKATNTSTTKPTATPTPTVKPTNTPTTP
jgi:hypothetical protein